MTLVLISVFFGLEAQETDHIPGMDQTVKTREMRYREPVLAGILSALIPGAGQLYNQQTVKGVIFMGVFVGSAIMVLSDYNYDSIYNESGSSTTAVVGGVIMFGIWVTAIVDGVISAKKINQKYGLSLEFRQIPSLENVGVMGSVPSLTVSFTLGK
ncbi:DUF5683 domain-containing protein [Fulvivirga sedimenti]|uniref:DUF5683 domain-containing protein n=1 Tax=Fulvivirga sedimenti TaxID=2879465 RepID=A0A9X1HT14_9BACT|nr:DUF5683 domain-containing protein [Fulvivirga sedimenti]MCA6075637.1 DUF5683 domain-containing protein [Fulvivirga sedimenti]